MRTSSVPEQKLIGELTIDAMANKGLGMDVGHFVEPYVRDLNMMERNQLYAYIGQKIEPKNPSAKLKEAIDAYKGRAAEAGFDPLYLGAMHDAESRLIWKPIVKAGEELEKAGLVAGKDEGAMGRYLEQVLDRFGARSGKKAADLTLKEGRQELKDVMSDPKVPWPNLAVSIETSQGAAVDQLVQKGYTVYPVHPVAAQSYRERKAPSGTKTDHLDAWALADALRVDGHGLKTLQPMDPMTQQLRLLCRDVVVLIEQRTALVNALLAALHEYYPAALVAFDDWTDTFTWDFVIEFPTPQTLVKAGKRRWEKFLHTHRLWRPETTEKRLKLFAQADQFKASDPMLTRTTPRRSTGL